MKKVLALLLAIMMIVSLSALTLAAEDEPVDASTLTKTYVAYKIFSGTQANGTAELAGIQWGDGVANPEQLILALREANGTLYTKNCKTAEDVALVVSGFKDDDDNARQFASICCKNKDTSKGISLAGNPTLEPGYYLIVDETDYKGTVNAVRNLSLLQLTQKEEFEIAEKVTVPEVEKKVYEETGKVWQEAADYDIGDSVPFRITATIGEIRGFDCYTLIFHDTLSDGLTFNEDAPVTVTLYHNSRKSITTTVIDDYDLDVKGQYITLTIEDLVDPYGAVKDDTVVVTYEAFLNEQAKKGVEGNPNKVYLEYSNNPQDGCNKETGKTPEEEVIVYTWGVHVNKVTKGEGDELKPLDGAKFSLYKKDGTVVAEDVAVEAVMKDGEVVAYTAKFDGLDSGEYTLKETTIPDGYNGIEPIDFKIIATFTGTEVNEFSVDNKDFTVEDGIVIADIVNQLGIVLPETGGEGTKLLTLIGAVALISGMVFVITKKRVGVED